MKLLIHSQTIPKRCSRWSFRMDKEFHPTLSWECEYLSVLGLKLIHFSKRGPLVSPDWVIIGSDNGLYQAIICTCVDSYMDPEEQHQWNFQKDEINSFEQNAFETAFCSGRMCYSHDSCHRGRELDELDAMHTQFMLAWTNKQSRAGEQLLMKLSKCHSAKIWHSLLRTVTQIQTFVDRVLHRKLQKPMASRFDNLIIVSPCKHLRCTICFIFSGRNREMANAQSRDGTICEIVQRIGFGLNTFSLTEYIKPTLNLGQG